MSKVIEDTVNEILKESKDLLFEELDLDRESSEEEQKKVREELNLPDPNSEYETKKVVICYPEVLCPYCNSKDFENYEYNDLGYAYIDENHCDNCGLDFDVVAYKDY